MATERRPFTIEEIERVWEKAFIQEGNNPNNFRKDYAGAWIKRDQYGNRQSPYGWEIDHIRPLSDDGTYELDNLVPLHWKNNDYKSDNFPEWQTVMSSEGIKNVNKVKSWILK